MREALMKKYDKNGNGMLDPEERKAAMEAMQQRSGSGGKPSAGGLGAGMNPQMRKALMKKHDKNGNGMLDPDEREAAMQAIRQRQGPSGGRLKSQ